MKSIAVAAALLLLASRVHATVIEIPLPGLLGSYQNTQRTTTIVLPGLPSVIHGASIRLAGVAASGQFDCTIVGGGIGPFWMDFTASMNDDSPSRVWLAGYQPTESASFTATKVFFKTPISTTWSFLLDGTGAINLLGIDPLSACNVSSSCSTAVTEAVFIIDADFPVAVEPSTWGKIKALYR